MGGASAAILLRTDRSQVFRLERFIDGFTAASAPARLRAKLVVSELFDNLLEHGRGVRPPLVSLRLRSGPPLA
jgi:anti-sigma regulatory factor (Ser/Thr protein kinase)